MGRLARPLLAAAAVLASASAPAWAGCDMPPPDGNKLGFFATIQPSDSVLDVWCRLHTLLPAGNYRAKLIFSAPKRKMFDAKYRAEREFNLKIDKAEADPRMQVARMIQSVIPTGKGSLAKSPDGQPFPLALEWVVQGTAPTTPEAPESQGLGLPPSFPGARSYAFWMPMALKISPVNLYGRNFHLQVVFRPHVTRLIQALEGKSERFILKAAADKAFPFGDTAGCPEDRAPDCKGAPDTIDMYTAWFVDSVTLTSADPGHLSETTDKLVKGFLAAGIRPMVNTMAQDFTFTEGRAKLEIQTDTREIQLNAIGDPDKASGTRAITIVERERPKLKGTYATWLDDTAQAERDRIVLTYGSGAPSR